MNENIVEGKPCINREIKSLEFTIYLYRCYDYHEAPSSCNTTVYLSQYLKNATQILIQEILYWKYVTVLGKPKMSGRTWNFQR